MNFGDYDPENCDGHYVLDDKGNPRKEPSLMKWARIFDTRDDRVVKQEQIGRSWVSTVFLGLDHAFSVEDNHAPVLWETMVFGIGPHDHDMDRCSGNREQAEAMHQRMVTKVMESEGLWIYLSFLWTFFRWVNRRIIDRAKRRIKPIWCRMFHSEHWEATHTVWTTDSETDGSHVLCLKCHCLPFHDRQITVSTLNTIKTNKTRRIESDE